MSKRNSQAASQRGKRQVSIKPMDDSPIGLNPLARNEPLPVGVVDQDDLYQTAFLNVQRSRGNILSTRIEEDGRDYPRPGALIVKPCGCVHEGLFIDGLPTATERGYIDARRRDGCRIVLTKLNDPPFPTRCPEHATRKLSA